MTEIKEVGTNIYTYSYVHIFLIHFISEILSVALGTCRCSMGGQCPVLSWISRQTLPERNQCFCQFVLHQFPQGMWYCFTYQCNHWIIMEMIVGPCESRLLNYVGARSKTFKRGSGHHTGLFENESCRYWLVLDSSVRPFPTVWLYSTSIKELSLNIETGILVSDVDSALWRCGSSSEVMVSKDSESTFVE